MKKALRKTEFEYRCFPCRKQDDKARSYSISYDLILHMVNTHKSSLPTPSTMRIMRRMAQTFVTQPLKKEKSIVSPLYTNARNRKPNPLVEKTGARPRQHRKTKVKSGTRITAIRDDEMSEPFATEMKEGRTEGGRMTRAGVRPAVIL